MSYLDKVRRCNARDLAHYRPFLIAQSQVGHVAPARADILANFPEVFDVRKDAVRFNAQLPTPAQRTSALQAITGDLSASGAFQRPTGELYGVKNDWHEAEVFRLERAFVPGFGARAYGVHVNGFVRRSSGLHLWIGTRAMDRTVEPGKLDNMVAGGQPAGLGLMENVIKECAEEAGLSEPLALRAKPVGVLNYAFDAPAGLKNDCLFCFDLELPEHVMPTNHDGEISRFELMPLAEVLALVRETDQFKFNVNLVILDFAIRHGALSPDAEPDYETIVRGLHGCP